MTMGLSQSEAAKLLGVDQSKLARWERGEPEPAGALLARAERFLDDMIESRRVV
jgi:transcriptional regulator with XRE-family HTH domain